MANTIQQWDEMAGAIGYKNEKEMFQDLYIKQGMAIFELADIIGVAHNTIRRRLLMYDIKIRPRGGNNNDQHSKLSGVTDADLEDAKACALKHGVHLSTVFKEKRRREKCISVELAKILPSTLAFSEKTGTSVSRSGSETTPNTSNTSETSEGSATTS